MISYLFLISFRLIHRFADCVEDKIYAICGVGSVTQDFANQYRDKLKFRYCYNGDSDSFQVKPNAFSGVVILQFIICN